VDRAVVLVNVCGTLRLLLSGLLFRYTGGQTALVPTSVSSCGLVRSAPDGILGFGLIDRQEGSWGSADLAGTWAPGNDFEAATPNG